MTKLIWTPEHGQQLKQLREAAGLSVAELATQHALSKGHVVQLEDGGQQRFLHGGNQIHRGPQADARLWPRHCPTP